MKTKAFWLSLLPICLCLSCQNAKPNPSPKCVAGKKPWVDQSTAFVDATERVGLKALDVRGVRLSAVDFNGDHYPDLVIRRGGYHREQWQANKRHVWLLQNRGDGTFKDVTKRSNFLASRGVDGAQTRPVEVVAWGDIDNDGDLDAVTGFSSKTDPSPTLSVMLNEGQGTFKLHPKPIQTNQPGAKTQVVGGITLTDVNRDGWLDVWVGHGMAQDRLYLGDGQGNFTERTDALGLRTAPWTDLRALNAGKAHSNAWSSAACDLDGNGVPDLLASSYGRAPNHLWLGAQQPTLRYQNFSVPSGYAYDQGQDWRDNESARCHCKINPKDAQCEGVKPPIKLKCEVQKDAFRWLHTRDREAYRLGGNSGTTVCADLNGDGKLDLLTTEIVHEDVGSSSDVSEILLNTGQGRFVRPGNAKMGLTRTRKPQRYWNDGDITAAAMDFDHDGRLDIYIGSTSYDDTRGWLYHQQSNGRFKVVSKTHGIDHLSSHGVAVADFDRDGDLDIVVGHARFRCSRGTHCYKTDRVRYFENVAGTTHGNWAQLTLKGTNNTNGSAIGAQVTVVDGSGRRTVHEVGGGHGHYGIQHQLPVHLGLGDQCEVAVEVRWPDAKQSVQRLTLGANTHYTLKQNGKAQPIVFERKRPKTIRIQ